MKSPFRSTRSGAAPSCSPPRATLTMRYSGFFLRNPANGLADLGRIFQPVDAQAERSEAGEAAAFEVPDPELFLIFLGRRFCVDAPPAWQIFSHQDDADGTPDAGDAVDSAISSLRFGKELVYGCSNRISMSDA